MFPPHFSGKLNCEVWRVLVVVVVAPLCQTKDLFQRRIAGLSQKIWGFFLFFQEMEEYSDLEDCIRLENPERSWDILFKFLDSSANDEAETAISYLKWRQLRHCQGEVLTNGLPIQFIFQRPC